MAKFLNNSVKLHTCRVLPQQADGEKALETKFSSPYERSWSFADAYHVDKTIIIIIIIVIIIILVITFMQGMYKYVPETIHVPRLYSVAAILYLQFVLHVILFCPRSMFFAVPLFYAYLVCDSGIVRVIFKWFRLPLLLMVSLLLSHSTCAEFVLRSLYIKIFLASFLITSISRKCNIY
jgi:hypothetical protein